MTTARDYFTLQGDGASINPHIASRADMGGSDKENDAEAIPDPNDPDAREWNQMVDQIAHQALVGPVARIYVKFSGGTPSVFAIYSGNPDLDISDITITDSGTGVTLLAIPATLIPDVRWGDCSIQQTGNNRGTAFRSASQTLRVETYDADSGAAADVDFVAGWY